jgi:hypothetical protein
MIKKGYLWQSIFTAMGARTRCYVLKDATRDNIKQGLALGMNRLVGKGIHTRRNQNQPERQGGLSSTSVQPSSTRSFLALGNMFMLLLETNGQY